MKNYTDIQQLWKEEVKNALALALYIELYG